MRVVTPRRLKDYAELRPAAKSALLHWYEIVRQAEWQSLSDIKAVIGSVDYVGNNRYVFNIKGNDHRLIVIIIFVSQKIYIRFIGTHSEYDKIDATSI